MLDDGPTLQTLGTPNGGPSWLGLAGRHYHLIPVSDHSLGA